MIHVTPVILSGQNWSRRSYLQTPRRWVSDIASFTHALKPSHDVVLVIYLCNHVNKILCDERTRLSAGLLAGWTVFCRLYCNNGVVFALNTVQNSNFIYLTTITKQVIHTTNINQACWHWCLRSCGRKAEYLEKTHLLHL